MCFSLEWLRDVLIWIIVICAVVALIQLLTRFVVPKLTNVSAEVISFIIQALTIIMWAVICIAAVIFIFSLISCLGPSMPRIR